MNSVISLPSTRLLSLRSVRRSSRIFFTEDHHAAIKSASSNPGDVSSSLLRQSSSSAALRNRRGRLNWLFNSLPVSVGAFGSSA